MDPAKVKVMTHWTSPKTSTEVRSYLGMTEYYRRFIKDFSMFAGPLTQLTRKATEFKWTRKCERSFYELKHWLTSTLVLTLTNPNEELSLYTDASGEGLGVLLMKTGRL